MHTDTTHAQEQNESFLERQECESILFRARSMILEEFKALDVFFSSRESRRAVLDSCLPAILDGSRWYRLGVICPRTVKQKTEDDSSNIEHKIWRVKEKEKREKRNVITRDRTRVL